MTITHSSTRFVAIVAGVAVAVALIAGAFAAPSVQAASLTSAQVSAIISLLQSFGADAATIANVQASLTGGTPAPSTGGSGSACYAWATDLSVGSTGADVMALQVFLNANGAMVAATGAGSPGMETLTFGPLTRSALAKWQAANGVAPALGYFGPITRAAVKVKCSVTPAPGPGPGPTPTPGLQGGEGSLDVNGNLGDVESDVDEGDEDAKVLGVELEAQDSDIMLERVDVDIDLSSGTGSTNLDNYIDEVSLWLDGEKIGSLDVDEADEDSDVFSFRFTGLKGVIEEDAQGELFVAVTAVSNVDTGDIAKGLDVDIPANGIRAVDGAGLSETYVTAGEVTAETFNVTEATAGDLDISEGDDNPESAVVQVDEDDDTTGVLVMEFDLDANNQDVVVNDIPVGFVTTENEGVDGPVKRAILKMDGTTLDTVSIPAAAGTSYRAIFEDLDLDIDDGDTATFQVFVDLNDADVTTFATSSTLYATTTGSDDGWDVEDAAGDSITPDGSLSNSSDGVFTFETEGIQATFVSANAVKSFEADASTEQDVGTFTITFDVTAFDQDVYLDRTVTRDDATAGGSDGDGFMWATTTDSTVGTTTGGTASISVADASAEFTATSASGGGLFKVNSGQTERFTLTVLLDASDIDGYAAVKLTSINWTTDSTDTAPNNDYTSNLLDFKTANLNLNTI